MDSDTKISFRWTFIYLVVFASFLLGRFISNKISEQAPETIEVNGFVYERQTEPEQTIEKYGCTYVLKEGETE